MNFLFVYPKMPDTFYALKHFIKVVGKKAAFPPLGLMTISALIPKKYNRKLVDLNVEPLSDAHLQWADYVFVSAMNVQEESVREIIAQCKKSKVKIVAGGPLFTHEHERFTDIDYFVLNEGEITLPLFLKDLEQNNLKRIYETREFADVTESPIPDFNIVNMQKYLYAIVQYSRGCPYLCDFCDVTALFGRKPRTKTPQQIIAELEEIAANKLVQLVLFADDNLIGNKRILKSELLPALIEWRKVRKPNFYFATQLTVNLADDEELMQLLLDAGFRHVFIGIETPDEDSLKVAHKNQNLKRNMLETIHLIHQKGFIISGGFIVGFDTDTPSSFKRIAEFIQASGIPLPIVNVLKAPPGTELFERMKRENRLIKDFAFEEGDTNIEPTLGLPVVLNGFLDVTKNIYTPEKSYIRIKNFLRMHQFPKSTVRIKTPFYFEHILIVLRVIWLVGIYNKNALYFWRLLTWTYFFNRKFLDKAVFYGIMIHQMSRTHQYISYQVKDQLKQNKLKIAS